MAVTVAQRYMGCAGISTRHSCDGRDESSSPFDDIRHEQASKFLEGIAKQCPHLFAHWLRGMVRLLDGSGMN
jgi:hypothetical protein